MAQRLTWDYVFAFDPVPQQAPEFNKLHRYYQNLQDGRLTTTECAKCGKVYWPPRTVCPECFSNELSFVELPEIGEIIVVTLQEGGAFPGFPPPLAFALLQFGPLRFIGKLVDVDPAQVGPGKKVRLKVEQQEDGRVLPAFTLAN
ncbi:MAG: Zn-ribbon domain-containing OB-fold protein [Desulfitobacteriaceae bacterium]